MTILYCRFGYSIQSILKMMTIVRGLLKQIEQQNVKLHSLHFICYQYYFDFFCYTIVLEISKLYL